ncbi:helix-turn-helix domain-containing protein [Acidicapsa acidisoli]|uniref:helix-turn-helix domain-containing protein n=1 Tax=Acidicapsa acidisoli TaxID=1615681 RepID=UPI0021E05D13|nr:helix-turn-helix domain-containing protein [Acidicapsa acidisoli]
MGAPRKHPPAGAATTIEAMAAQGHAIVGIAKHFGVSRETFKRWCDEDEAIQEAFEIGREAERQALHALVVQSAVMNKPANVNAFFILKSRHGYRENDSPNTNVNVGVAVAPTNVLVIKDHGTDEEWAAKALAQQRALTAPEAAPRQLEGAKVASASIYEPQVYQTEPEAVASSPAYFGPPSWKPQR